MLKFVAATAAILAVLTTQPVARSAPTNNPANNYYFCGDRYCWHPSKVQVIKPKPRPAPELRCASHGCREARVTYRRGKKIVHKARRGIVAYPRVAAVTRYHGDYPTTQIMPHPAGCPSSRFCGCGVSVKVFGVAKRELYLAANWLKYPRTAPAAGMVAARRGHVFYIEQVMGDGRVLAYDPNSGRRQTRLHVRSLAGFTVVDPRGSRYARG